jgi:hypothetical protein
MGSGGPDKITLQAGSSFPAKAMVGIDTTPETMVAIARPAMIFFMKRLPRVVMSVRLTMVFG